MKYFETIKCNDFEVFNLKYHHTRIAKTIGKNLNLQEYINPISPKLLRCKVVYDKNEILSVEYFPYKKREIKSFKIVFDDNIEYSKKYLNRENLDEFFLQKGSCDEIIIIKNGFITDTTIANIAVFENGFWFTPKTPLLAGTTRARLIDDKKLFEKDITLQMLQNAEKIALLNAMVDFDILNSFSFE